MRCLGIFHTKLRFGRGTDDALRKEIALDSVASFIMVKLTHVLASGLVDLVAQNL